MKFIYALRLNVIKSLCCFTFFALLHFYSFAQIVGPANVCEHSQSSYSVTGSFVSYTWGVTNGTGVASGNSFIVQWGPAGSGVVSVTLIDNVGNVSSQTLNVTIVAKPSAAISFTPPQTCPSAGDHNGSTKGGGCLKVCDSSVLNFTTPNVAGNTYQWSVTGNGTAISGSTGTSYTVQWGPVGNATVSLIVTNAAGCKDSDAVCFEVISKPQASFTTSNVCLGIAAIFNNTSVGATSYSWNFGDPPSGPANTSTLVNPTHTFSSAGTFTVTLIAENDCHCTDTFKTTITVSAEPGPQIFCPATVCQGDTAKYYTNANCTSYTWTVSGNGTIISGAGTNTIMVVWNSGPIGTVSLLVGGCTPSGFCTTPTVVKVPIIPPTLTISGTQTPCEGSTECYSIPFFDGTITSWSVTPSVPFTVKSCNEICINWPFTGGTYVIQVNYNNSFLGCSGSASLPVTVLPSMFISGPQKACSAGSSNFTSVASGLVSCNWTISPAGPTFTGNGTPTITVSWNGNTGFYTITATAITNGLVCNSPVTLTVQVVASPPPPTITGPTIVCPNSAQSYIASTGTNLTWSVIGGTLSSTSGNPVNVIWGPTPPYSITVYQTDPSTNCQSDTSTLTVHSFLPLATPVIGGPNNSCPEGTSTYTCTTTYPPGVSLNWNISPSNYGSIISGQGTSTITVQWANVPGQSAAVTASASVCNQTVTSSAINVSILNPPALTVSQSGNPCPGNTITLSVPSCGGCTYSWLNPNNIQISTTNTASATLAGIYTVTVTNSAGCSRTVTYNLIFNPAPSAIVNPTTINICQGSPINATFYAQTGVGWTFLWTGGSTNPVTTFHAVGTYNLTVTNSYGCTATTSVTVTNNPCITCNADPNYNVNFSILQSSPNCSSVTFKNTSTVGSTNPSWNFGDASGGTGNIVTHTYTVAGVYPVTLCVDVPNLSPPPPNCTICKTKNVTIPVVAKFSANICGCIPVQFVNQTTFAPSITGTYAWNFGDPGSGGNNTSSAINPTHTFSTSGLFTVTLTVTTSSGCVSTYTLNVNIPALSASFTAPSTGCKNNPVNFTNTSINGVPVTYSWNFGDGITSNLTNAVHTYTTANTYTVTLTTTDACGCTKTFSQNITISNACCNGVLTAIPNTPVCPGTNITLTAPACGSTYFWSNGAVTNSNTLQVNQTGTYSVLIVDPNSCKCNIPPINVIVNPAPLAIITGSPQMCMGTCEQLFTSFSPSYSYIWKDGGGNTVSTNSSYFFCPGSPGTYSFTVSITDDSTNCSATSLPFAITVYPSPTVSITASGPTTFCSGGSVTLTANPVTSGLTYSWNTGDNTPSILVLTSGIYTVTVTDNNGCTATASMAVTVNPVPDLCGFQCGCYTKCSPYTIQGPPGGLTYQWLFNGVNIPGATNQNYTATNSGNYSVVLSNSFGCMDTTCDLDLTLIRCDSVCAQLVKDSVYCDSTGNVHLTYQVYNGSGHTITGWSLHLIPPDPNILVMNDTAIESVNSGDSSTIHDAILFGGTTGQRLCFVVGIYRLDEFGNSLFCCQSDTLCFNWPDCPADCGEIVIDDVTCNASGYSINYHVKNLSTTNINEWIVSLYPPQTGVSLNSNIVSTSLPADSTSSIHTLNVTGASPGDQICFAVSLHELDQYGYCLFCCTSSAKTCLTLPFCSDQMAIHPNPSKENITIESKSAGHANEVRIFDMTGKLMLLRHVNNNTVQLSIRDLPAGTYMVQMLGEHLSAHGKFIKQ